jgi:GNAT superfamily N-acetyltransferase
VTKLQLLHDDFDEGSNPGDEPIIEATLDGEELYPDEFIIEILAKQFLYVPSATLHPGINNYSLPGDGSDVFCWADDTGTPRAVLTICDGPPVDGESFTILVHPAWRRRGLARKLYLEAASFYDSFDFDEKPLYTADGAAWAMAMMKVDVDEVKP